MAWEWICKTIQNISGEGFSLTVDSGSASLSLWYEGHDAPLTLTAEGTESLRLTVLAHRLELWSGGVLADEE
ncbi:MAG: hypothetical protein IJ493_08200 [Clostridia bacterium]|nr:hypothetical protein [Clostridia bacterium]